MKKMKRYEGGGDVDDDVDPEVIRRSRSSGVRVNYDDDDESPKRARRFGKKPDDKSDDGSYDRKEKSRSSESSKKSDDEDTGAATGRMLAKRDKRSAGEKAAENKYIRENITAPLVASVGPGRVAKGVYEVGKAANAARRMGNVAKAYDAEKAAAAGERASKLAEFEAKRAARREGIEGRMGVTDEIGMGYKRGGSIKSSASRRADGIASRGKTKGRML
jgi:hypothetical protein